MQNYSTISFPIVENGAIHQKVQDFFRFIIVVNLLFLHVFLLLRKSPVFFTGNRLLHQNSSLKSASVQIFLLEF